MPKSSHHISLVNDASFDIDSDESILKASLKKGIPFYCECGGKARCSTCRVEIIEGEENLSERNTAETKLKEYLNLPDNIRLACQTYVKKGSVTARRVVNDTNDHSWYKLIADRGLGKELRLCLLFLDIRNFTPFVEHHLAFDVIHVIRKLFFDFEKIITQHGGKIIETTGDGIYAAFGFKEVTQKSAINTINCGRQLLEKLEELNENHFKNLFGIKIEVGIGAHLGKVATGDLLLKGTSQQVVMGYAVNIASRIQNLTKKHNNNFIISEEIFSFLDTPPPYQTVTERLKGVKEPFDLYLIGSPFHYQ